jgi:serine/threonine-protein kinase RsbW
VPMSPATHRGGTTGETLRLAHDPRAAREARARLRADLQSREVPTSVIDDAEIVLSELVGNAVRHAHAAAGGTVLVQWRVRGDLLDLEVTDGGGGEAPVRRPDTEAVDEISSSGRGLTIVAAMCRSWGVVDSGAGRTVWASIVQGPRLFGAV